MQNQMGVGAKPTVLTEQDNEWANQRREDLHNQATVFESQLAALEQEYARSTALLKMLGLAFGFGAAGKLERARFKVSYKRQQLAEFESLQLDGRIER
jgi:hypothetical protein